METHSSPPNERVEVDLSSSAVVALVSLTSIFSCLFLLIYCHCYCNEEPINGGREPGPNWRTLFRKRRHKLRSTLPLPVVSYKKKAGEIALGCVVCLNEFEDKEEVKIIPGCGHMFHPECIDRWLVRHWSCPVCRSSKFIGDTVGSGEEAVVEIGEGEEVVEAGVLERREAVRMVRSQSWSSREVDGGSSSGGGLRRSCSI